MVARRGRTGATRQAGFAAGRLIFWLALAVWAGLSWVASARLAADLRFRVNDLGAIPGAGLINRDPAGTFYHVNTEGRARSIYPTLEPPVYRYECLDCSLVTGEQMSQTNDFCVSGKQSELPELHFEIPCRTWAPIGEGRKVVAAAIFILPVLAFLALRALARQGLAKTRTKT